MSTRRIIILVLFGLFLASTPIMFFKAFENLKATEVMLVQAPLSGEITCYITPGTKYQGFGEVIKFPRRATYDFSVDEDSVSDNSKKLRFNDGGHANLYGSVSWEMPTDCTKIIEIYRTFTNTDGVVSSGVAKMVDLSIYLSGPLMSSTESSGERRAELVQLINDQAQNGVYQTSTRQAEVVDQITGEKRPVAQIEILKDASGNPKRQQGSILSAYGLTLLPISIKELRYDHTVEAQITERQKATTMVQIAKANASKAQQDAITIEAQGQATAAAERWKQEAIKAQQITLAQQNLEVQKLKTLEAEQYRVEQIRRGEGDAERRRLVMNADGALDQKVAAYIEVQKMWASAFSKFTGQMVPQVVMGGTGTTTSGNTMQNFVDLLSAKAARDLGVDMNVVGPVRNTTGRP